MKNKYGQEDEHTEWLEEAADFLIQAANYVGLGDWASHIFGNYISNWKRIRPSDLEVIIGKITAKAKAQGLTKYNLVLDQISKLQTMQSSPVTRRAINNALEKARKQQADMSMKINQAEAYEQANNQLVNDVASLSEYQQTTKRAYDAKDKIEQNANKVAEIYSNIDKEIK